MRAALGLSFIPLLRVEVSANVCAPSSRRQVSPRFHTAWGARTQVARGRRR